MADLTRVIPELAQRITGMVAEGAQQGLILSIACGFRPLADQERLYSNYLAYQKDPKHAPFAALAAIPGTSNHGKVVNGVQQDATAVDLDVIPQTPENLTKHGELAQKWGMYRAVPGEYWHLELDPHRGPMPNSSVLPTPNTSLGDDEEMADRMCSRWEIHNTDGTITEAKVYIDEQGNSYSLNCGNFGGIQQLPSNEREGFVSAIGITAVDLNNFQAGYVIYNQKGQSFKFDPAKARELGLV